VEGIKEGREKIQDEPFLDNSNRGKSGGREGETKAEEKLLETLRF